MNKKGLIALMTALLLFCIASISAFAQPQPRFTDTDSVTVRLSISGTTASCNVKIVGKAGTTLIEADMELQDENGNTVKSWSSSAESRTLNVTKTATVEKGQTYTLYIDATVYRNGGSESISVSKDATA